MCYRVIAGKTSGFKLHHYKSVQRVLELTKNMVGRCIIEVLGLNEALAYVSVV